MVPRPLAPARAIISRTCVDVIQPCLGNLSVFDVIGSKAAGEATSFPGSCLYLEKGRKRNEVAGEARRGRDATRQPFSSSVLLVLKCLRRTTSPIEDENARHRTAVDIGNEVP